jgi:hypothetical protein
MKTAYSPKRPLASDIFFTVKSRGLKLRAYFNRFSESDGQIKIKIDLHEKLQRLRRCSFSSSTYSVFVYFFPLEVPAYTRQGLAHIQNDGHNS